MGALRHSLGISETPQIVSRPDSAVCRRCNLFSRRAPVGLGGTVPLASPVRFFLTAPKPSHAAETPLPSDETPHTHTLCPPPALPRSGDRDWYRESSSRGIGRDSWRRIRPGTRWVVRAPPPSSPRRKPHQQHPFPPPLAPLAFFSRLSPVPPPAPPPRPHRPSPWGGQKEEEKKKSSSGACLCVCVCVCVGEAGAGWDRRAVITALPGEEDRSLQMLISEALGNHQAGAWKTRR